MSADDLKTWAPLAGAVATIGAALVSGLFLWLAARPKGKVDLVSVAQTAAREVIGSLQAELTRLAEEVNTLRSDVKALREERHDLSNKLMREKKRADLAEASVRALQQLVDSLQRRMRAAGLEVDAPGGYREPGLVLFDGVPPPAPPQN